MFILLLATIYNNWLRQGSIPRRVTRGIGKLLRKNKHGGDGISNFHLLTMLNTDLKILVKIKADRLLTVQSAALINLDQSKAFDRVDHGFMEAVLSAAGFGPHFRS